ncbi:protein kinase domain-containing protein [Aliinostoc sp. HNIBRCY26]|uniref:protein kinase domain-containing protein n=1 Tax=Aliinostoc sp. HNIBRCY26 TaxID=3418997 RepID=UPI003CFF84F3
MSYCINPNCLKPENKHDALFCQSCGSELLLEGCYRAARLLSDPNKPSGFGTIYEVEDHGRQKILKVLHNNHPKAVELFQQEANVLKQLQHPGIPQVESDGYFIYFPRNSQQPLHCLVMEKIEGMNLEEYLTRRNFQPIGERAAIRWLKQLAEILHQVHQQQYFHRDIKPANIMLRPDGQLVLIDFGTAREVTQTFIHKVSGQQVTGIISTGYTPPEQMNGKAVPQSDFFALGRTFVYLLTGKSPDCFHEDSRTGQLIWRDNTTEISPSLADLIDYLVSPFPGNRPKDTAELLNIVTQLENTYRTSNPKFSQKQAQVPVNSQNNYQQTPVYQTPISQTPVSLNYVGFWQRFVAYCIDLLILSILGASIGYIFGLTFPNFSHSAYTYSTTAAANNAGISGLFTSIGGTFGGLGVLFLLTAILTNYSPEGGPDIIPTLLAVILCWLYFTVLETFSKQQATIGKMFLGITVTDLNGNDISFFKANLRYWLKTISTIGLFIGFIIIGLHNKKQALHDLIAGTVVIKKR